MRMSRSDGIPWQHADVIIRKEMQFEARDQARQLFHTNSISFSAKSSSQDAGQLLGELKDRFKLVLIFALQTLLRIFEHMLSKVRIRSCWTVPWVL